MPRRKHRRVRQHWNDCGCPEGANFVPFANAPPYARKFLCIDPKGPQGARFVRAQCGTGAHRQQGERVPKAMRRKALRPQYHEQLPMLFPEDMGPSNQLPMLFDQELPSAPAPSKPKKKRGKPVDWTKCKCPENSVEKKTPKGVRYCWGKPEGGGRVSFVKPKCD